MINFSWWSQTWESFMHVQWNFYYPFRPENCQALFNFQTVYQKQWFSVMKGITKVSLKHDINMRNSKCQMWLVDLLIRLYDWQTIS